MVWIRAIELPADRLFLGFRTVLSIRSDFFQTTFPTYNVQCWVFVSNTRFIGYWSYRGCNVGWPYSLDGCLLRLRRGILRGLCPAINVSWMMMMIISPEWSLCLSALLVLLCMYRYAIGLRDYKCYCIGVRVIIPYLIGSENSWNWRIIIVNRIRSSRWESQIN